MKQRGEFYCICLTVGCGIWVCRHEEEKIAGNTRDYTEADPIGAAANGLTI